MRASRFLPCLLLLALALPAQADQLLMARSGQAFPEAMLTLQTAVGDQGYTVSRVQRVDIGLTASGFETDKYRIVFFGVPEEVRRLTAEYPDLIPYLPLKMTIFAEGDETLVVATNPQVLAGVVDAPELGPVFERWQRDIHAILDKVRDAG